MTAERLRQIRESCTSEVQRLRDGNYSVDGWLSIVIELLELVDAQQQEIARLRAIAYPRSREPLIGESSL